MTRKRAPWARQLLKLPIEGCGSIISDLLHHSRRTLLWYLLFQIPHTILVHPTHATFPRQEAQQEKWLSSVTRARRDRSGVAVLKPSDPDLLDYLIG